MSRTCAASLASARKPEKEKPQRSLLLMQNTNLCSQGFTVIYHNGEYLMLGGGGFNLTG